MMDVKKEILTICQLLGLLYLLFYSFTWNLPPDFDFFEPRSHLKSSPENGMKEVSRLDSQTISSVDGHKISNYLDRKDVQRLPTLSYSMLPPFNIWKEIKLTKQEQNEEQGKIPDITKLSRRKLNYASSKCGAKILASNKEAKHRVAILNEKIDEYMLNPCKAKSWFLVELCDNIKATQIELANYELYSSTPKLFQVFWSDVYPAKTWHHLGTFEAKDKRTMQTFELESPTMVKFIKVAFLSYYGKEHYCPLSVFRILGYSMVYEYDNMDLENKVVNLDINDTVITPGKMSEKVMNSKNGYPTPHEIQNKNKSFTINHKSESFIINVPSCQFLNRITSKSQYPHFCSNVCKKTIFKKSRTAYIDELHKINEIENAKPSKLFLNNKDINNKTTGTKEIESNNNSGLVLSNLFRGKEHLLQFPSFHKLQFLDRGPTITKQVIKDNIPAKTNSISILKRFNVNLPTEKNEGQFKTRNHNSYEEINHRLDSNDNCVCKKDSKPKFDKKYCQQTFDSTSQVEVLEQSSESAALIQKESVLVKLNSRIKASELNLDLINEYLQQLSQSYGHQMENMQNIINVTLKAIIVATEEANRIDEQQQLIIEHLEQQVKALDYQTRYLSDVQRDILKRVFELHGFFLILEFIIMSTIFSICVNKYRTKIYP